jgi:hypothetical protein
MLPSRWIRTSLVVILALIASMAAFQAPAEAATTGKVRGGIHAEGRHAVVHQGLDLPRQA